MNPQPPEYIGNIFAGFIILLIIIQTVKAYQNNAKIDLSTFDIINIGYLEESPISVNITQQSKNTFVQPQFFQDCVDTLYALGMKKKEAKLKAELIFRTCEEIPTTIQEFLILAMKKS